MEKNNFSQKMFSKFYKDNSPQIFCFTTDDLLVFTNDFDFFLQLSNLVDKKLFTKNKNECLEYLDTKYLSNELSSFWKNGVYLKNKILDCLVFGTKPKAVLETLPLILKAHSKIYKNYPLFCPAEIIGASIDNKKVDTSYLVFPEGETQQNKLMLELLKTRMMVTSLEMLHK